jgi:hypothetical protein
VEIETGTTEITVVTSADTSGMVKDVEDAKEAVTKKSPTVEIEGDAEKVVDAGEEATKQVDAMKASIAITASSSATSVINNIKNALDRLVHGGPYKV